MQPTAVPASSADETLAIARAAQTGAQVVALPVTRLSLQPTSTPSGRTTARAATASSTGGGGQSAAPTSADATAPTIIGRDGQQYRIATTPAETDLPQDSFRATPRNDFTSRNALKITRFGNTDIPSVVENEFTDLTVLRIQQAGQIVAAVASAAAVATVPPSVAAPSLRAACPPGRPLTAFSVLVQNLTPTGSFQSVPGQENCFEYEIRAVQGSGAADTVPRVQFRQIYIETGQDARVWPVPACRDVVFSVRRVGGEEVLAAPLRIADPLLLRLMPLPRKGKITFDPICGADLTDEPGDVWKTRTAVVEELAKQIKVGMNGWK